jgi:hypothetical protein
MIEYYHPLAEKLVDKHQTSTGPKRLYNIQDDHLQFYHPQILAFHHTRILILLSILKGILAKIVLPKHANI